VEWPFIRFEGRPLAPEQFFGTAWNAVVDSNAQGRLTPAGWQGKTELWEPWPRAAHLRVYYLGESWLDAASCYGYARITLAGPCTEE
jgi:hypothetical protein